MATRRRRAPEAQLERPPSRSEWEQLLHLQQTVTRTLAEAPAPAEGVQGALHAICQTESWDCGELWRSDPAGSVMRRFACWSVPGVPAAERFVELSGSHAFLPGEGLIGAVWQSGEPLWIPDAAKDPRAAHRILPEETGLRGALLCPLVVGGRTEGVLAFACCSIRPPDARLLQALNAIATQLGLYLRRMDSEARLRDSEARFRSLTELSSDWFWEQDDQYRFTRLEGRNVTGGGQKMGDEMLGRRCWDREDLEVEGGWPAYRERLEARTTFHDLLMWRRTPEGTMRYVRISGEPVFDAGGRFIGYCGVGRDVTAQKAAEESLRESEERFRRTFELAGSGLAHVSLDRRLLRVNRKLCEILGYPENELIGRSILELSHPDDATPTAADRERLYRGEIDSLRVEKRYVRKDGSIVWATLTLALERDAQGNPAYEISVYDDFTVRQAAEAIMRESEERFRRTFELAAVGVAHIGLDRRFQRVNRRFCEILGYPEAELIGRTGREFSHPEDSDHMNAQRPRLYAGEIEAARGEKRYLRRDGSVVWVAYTLAIERDASGAPQYEIAVYDDISSRKAAETALRDSEARFRSLTELSSDWYWELDTEYRFSRLEGRNVAGGDRRLRERLMGRRRWESDLAIEGGWEAHRALLEARKPFHDVLMWRTMPEGKLRSMSVSGEPVFTADGHFAGYRGVGRDVTPEKRAEHLLRLEHQVARALSEADDAASGLRAVMRAVCRSEGWACARYFSLDDARDALVFQHAWSADEPVAQQLLAGSAGLACRRGEGLAGLAWQKGDPVWSSDVAETPGLRAGFAFPVRSESRVIGVLAFSGVEPREPDARLRQATQVIGAQAGHFLRRMRAEENMRRFRLGLDSSADMILLIDAASMRFIDVNSTACSLLGYSREELLAMGPHDVMPATRDELASAYEALIAAPAVVGTTTGEYVCKGGARRPFESTRRVLRSGGGPIVVVISRDIRERIAAEEALRESEARFRALTEMSSDFFWETDAEHRLTDMVYGRGSSFGELDQGMGKAAWDLPSSHPDEAGWAALRARVEAHEPFRDFEFGRPRRDGGVRYFCVSGEPRFAADGRFLGYRGVGRDVTDLARARERIASLAYQDPLTGLANRTSLAPALEQAVERTRRRGNRLAGLFMDLDGFKEINDQHGHDAGDRLLAEVAVRVRAALRSSDPVARLGGDEFFVVLEDLQSTTPAERVAAKLLEAVKQPYDIGGGTAVQVSASIGVSVFPDDAGDAPTLMKHADTAMYEAKQAGKNAYRFFVADPAANDGRSGTQGQAL